LKRLVLLLDIDGTLLRCKGAPREALGLAMGQLFGHRGRLSGVRFGGKTDRIIVAEALSLSMNAASMKAVASRRFFEIYTRELTKQLTLSPPAVLPGARRLLGRLGRDPMVSFGLVSGNIRPGAYIKLVHAALEGFFLPLEVGAFAEEADRKADLGGVVRKRIAAIRDFEEADLVLVGDTPSDVECARQAGARAVAVTTGSFGRDELAGADVILEGLDSKEAEEAIRG